MQISARRSPQLAALIRTTATLPKEINRQVRQQSKRVVEPEWKRALAEHAPGAKMFHDQLVAPSSATISDRNVQLNAGKNGRRARETEFGAYREEYNSYSRGAGRVTREGTTFTRRGGRVTRRTQRQFWHFNPKGHAVYPAARDIIPRIGALWVQTAIRTVHELIEKAR